MNERLVLHQNRNILALALCFCKENGSVVKTDCGYHM